MKSYRTSEFVMLQLLLYCCEIKGLVADLLMNGCSAKTRPKVAYLCNPRDRRDVGRLKQYVEKLVSKLLNFKFGL
jgi:hypothetical protein